MVLRLIPSCRATCRWLNPAERNYIAVQMISFHSFLASIRASGVGTMDAVPERYRLSAKCKCFLGILLLV